MDNVNGRIVKGVGGLYFVDTENGVYKCGARGIFRKDKKTPVIGDLVSIDIIKGHDANNNGDGDELTGSICRIYERRNCLVRPKVSNVDQAVIIFSIVSPDINIDILDRFIILAEKQNVNITICINKIDLIDNKALTPVLELYSGLYEIVPVSTKKSVGLEKLKQILDRKITVFAGPSGVGKSSVINCLTKPDIILKTGAISAKIQRGKHTTRQIELLKAWENTFIIDSPGFTSLSLDGIVESELQNYFLEFRPYLNQCRFADCLHINEPSCMIREHIGDTIKKWRYDRYCELLLEFKKKK